MNPSISTTFALSLNALDSLERLLFQDEFANTNEHDVGSRTQKLDSRCGERETLVPYCLIEKEGGGKDIIQDTCEMHWDLSRLLS